VKIQNEILLSGPSGKHLLRQPNLGKNFLNHYMPDSHGFQVSLHLKTLKCDSRTFYDFLQLKIPLKAVDKDGGCVNGVRTGRARFAIVAKNAGKQDGCLVNGCKTDPYFNYLKNKGLTIYW